MTKERKLAIEMWNEIKCIMQNEEMSAFDICRYKEDFCKNHGLNWLLNCYFCNYYMRGYKELCKKCPISFHNIYRNGCVHSVYGKLINKDSDVEEKIKCCDIIISALKGELKVKGKHHEENC